MVKFYSQSYTYDYPFPAVTLAYFLRYPNPYSTHVLSTDTISRHFDPDTQRLTTVRLHLKRSKLPAAVLKLLPRSILGASAGGDTQSFILEKSVVDIREGWMDTESRNLDFTGVLSVIEKQEFKRPAAPSRLEDWQGIEGATRRRESGGFFNFGSKSSNSNATKESVLTQSSTPEEKTDVVTTVTLHSHIGEKWKRATTTPSSSSEEPPEKQGFFKSWSTASIQRSIEIIGLKRARRSQPNAKEGMKVVLERMREGGLVAVLEGMRKDRERIMGAHGGVRGKGVNDDDE
ncbi:hypothetical protein GQ43DRAFT_462502 [Delitschia confertaspora ATCC 74209]|uniref:PRELI/MSF1 domain-containing protein n=1 Tax=Delitschia confertaspora ATCC 74209 TaxID=1513339 RepID=A0A9P4JN13_9PLEO|nr:hypothetical protein GQ43DRAFT_462502 [Delitschia confertaspora ATCC 74209]